MAAAADPVISEAVVDGSVARRIVGRTTTLEELARLCRSGRDSTRAIAIEASGFPALDAALPGGGWQSGSMVELLPDEIGIGELRLIMPALARMTQAERPVALISPPFIPFAAALLQQGLRLEQLLIIRAEQPVDALWACEQALRCKSFGAVIAWPVAIKDREIRRLQLAAEAGHSIGFMYRAPAAAMEASPSATRLRLRSSPQGLSIDILKCRGGRSGQTISLSGLAPLTNGTDLSAPAPSPLGEGRGEGKRAALFDAVRAAPSPALRATSAAQGCANAAERTDAHERLPPRRGERVSAIADQSLLTNH